jgi:branched-chain amino acid transport system ATP-binding protein/urea transport system ATP-binding protein
MSEVVIETRDLSVHFGGVSAVDNVNFSLRERELRCLIGPNGAGKSTFFKSMTGQLRGAESSGRVLIRGYRIMRLGVGVKTQVPSVMNGLTIEENLWLSAIRTDAAAADAVVEEIVTEMALQPIARRQVSELAHGQRQLVEIGMVLANRPSLVLLDEPAAGVTGNEMERLVSIIRKINRNAAMIVVDHDMHFVRMLEAQITVFNQGSILVEGTADHVLNDQRVREVYLGTRAR